MKKIIALLLSMMMVLSMAACGSSGASSAASQSAPATTAASTGEADGSEATTAAIPGLEDGVFTVAMECAYAPYNWTQTDDSNGAVPIKDSNEYANGYDIMIAQKDLRGQRLAAGGHPFRLGFPGALRTGRYHRRCHCRSVHDRRAQ